VKSLLIAGAGFDAARARCEVQTNGVEQACSCHAPAKTLNSQLASFLLMVHLVQVQLAIMLTIINYHETAERLTTSDPVVLSDALFARQVDIVVESGVAVASAGSWPPQTTPGVAAPCLAITFDDGRLSDLKNAERLARKGLTATFFVCSAHLGKPGYLAASHLREMLSTGMAIGSHSHQHIRLTEMSAPDVAQQLLRSKAILEDSTGMPIDRLAFPGGAWNPLIQTQALQAGFRHTFGTAWGVFRQGQGSGPACRFNILRSMSDASFTRLIQLRDWRARRLAYLAKEAFVKVFPDSVYAHLKTRLTSR
jgi:peptidoglycan/xylan/chitin deacetylase (PgdA/CDA1 family)